MIDEQIEICYFNRKWRLKEDSGFSFGWQLDQYMYG